MLCYMPSHVLRALLSSPAHLRSGGLCLFRWFDLIPTISIRCSPLSSMCKDPDRPHASGSRCKPNRHSCCRNPKCCLAKLAGCPSSASTSPPSASKNTIALPSATSNSTCKDQGALLYLLIPISWHHDETQVQSKEHHIPWTVERRSYSMD